MRFTIVQISPTCEREGSFLRRGEAGVNRVGFSGRVGGAPLSAGTYRVFIKPVGSNSMRSTASTTFVIVAPGDSVQDARRQPSTCTSSEPAATQTYAQTQLVSDTETDDAGSAVLPVDSDPGSPGRATEGTNDAAPVSVFARGGVLAESVTGLGAALGMDEQGDGIQYVILLIGCVSLLAGLVVAVLGARRHDSW